MSYNKRTWANGNVVGAVDLNRMEEGIEDAGSGQVLVVNVTNENSTLVLSNTWQEIYDAFPNVYINESNRKSLIFYISSIDYTVSTTLVSYVATSANDYPTGSTPK